MITFRQYVFGEDNGAQVLLDCVEKELPVDADPDQDPSFNYWRDNAKEHYGDKISKIEIVQFDGEWFVTHSINGEIQ